MLINEQYSNIPSLVRKIFECLLDSGGFCFGIYDEKVLLRVRRLGDMLFSIVKNSFMEAI